MVRREGFDFSFIYLFWGLIVWDYWLLWSKLVLFSFIYSVKTSSIIIYIFSIYVNSRTLQFSQNRELHWHRNNLQLYWILFCLQMIDKLMKIIFFPSLQISKHLLNILILDSSTLANFSIIFSRSQFTYFIYLNILFVAKQGHYAKRKWWKGHLKSFFWSC